jgi:Bacterial PH domain
MASLVPAPVTREGVRVAETIQRFILRWSYRDLARFIGYPVGGLLVVGGLLLLVFTGPPFGESDDWPPIEWILACGLASLLWTWFIDRRLRVEVTEQKVTVVNLFSRYEVPWSALNYVDLHVVGYHSGGGPFIYCLEFGIPPNKAIVARMPRGNLRRMTEILERILQAGDQSLANETQPDAHITVKGLAAVGTRLFGPATLPDLRGDHVRAGAHPGTTNGPPRDVGAGRRRAVSRRRSPGRHTRRTGP